MIKDRFKEVRKYLKLSQTEMADALEIAVSTYQYYERGKRQPTFDVIERFVVKFNFNPNDLFDYKIFDTKFKKESAKWKLERGIGL